MSCCAFRMILLLQLLDFDVQRLIAHGTDGAVFLANCKQARHPNKSKQYALKVMFNVFQLSSVTQVSFWISYWLILSELLNWIMMWISDCCCNKVNMPLMDFLQVKFVAPSLWPHWSCGYIVWSEISHRWKDESASSEKRSLQLQEKEEMWNASSKSIAFDSQWASSKTLQMRKILIYIYRQHQLWQWQSNYENVLATWTVIIAPTEKQLLIREKPNQMKIGCEAVADPAGRNGTFFICSR